MTQLPLTTDNERPLAITGSGKHALPDFLIIGAQKGGTTSLYDYLCQHPQIRTAAVKEVQYFDWNYARGPEWYRQHFPRTRWCPGRRSRLLRNWITGEASPYYLRASQAPQRVATFCRQQHHALKFIVILRDPTTRAYSHYQMSRNYYQAEPLTFEEALAAEPARLADELPHMEQDASYISMADILYGYYALGCYASQLQRWFEYFPISSFLILDSGELSSMPAKVYQQTIRFLGLKEWQPTKFERHNQGHYPPIPERIEHALRQRFHPHNEALFNMIGRRFTWA